MAASISAVAATCASAPTTTQGQKTSGGRGGSCPSAIITAARKTKAKGNPNRKRTWVAPTVPSLAGSSRCVAHGLRGSGNDGKDDPEPRRIEHRNLWDYPSGAALAPPVPLPLSSSTIDPYAENMKRNARRARVP